MYRISLSLVLALGLAALGCRGDDDAFDARVNPIDGGAGTTIYDIQTPGGTASLDGSQVSVSGVIVTAIDRFGTSGLNTIWVQEPAGGAYSGILLYPGSGGFNFVGATIDTLMPGDVIDITGAEVDQFIYTGFPEGTSLTELKSPDGTQATITKISSGAVPAPTVLLAASLASAAEFEKWVGVLIRVENVAVQSIRADDIDQCSMTVTGGVTIEAGLMPLAEGSPLVWAYAVDDCFASVTGVGDFFFTYKIKPRSTADIVAGTACVVDPGLLSTIPELQDGTVGDGVKVRVEDAVVVAQSFNNKYAWIADGTATGAQSGVVIYDAAGTLALTVGDVVDVVGITDEYYNLTEITSASVTDTGTGTVPAANLVTVATVGQRNLLTGTDCAGGTCDVGFTCAITAGTGPYTYCGANTAEPWESVLVTVQNVKVATVATYDFTASSGSDRIVVGTTIYKATPVATVGTCYASVTGLLDYSYGAFKVLPRSAADLVTGGTCP